MRLLVTGGAGFIGANFVHLAAGEGFKVDVLDALTYAGNLENLNPVREAIDFVEGDITDTELVEKLVRRVDAVIHFAAESHNDNSFLGPMRFVQTNVVGTAVLLEAARQFGTRFHHISTDEVFGDLDYDDPAKFEPTTPYDPSQYYSATKAGADHLARAAARQFGQMVTISNCSNNYGPYQHVEKFLPRQITNILDGVKPRLYGDGRNVRDWIHVDDHNRAVLKILERGKAGETYLIGADGELDNRTVLQLILELMDRPANWYEHVPDRPAHDRRYAIDATRLREELGWEPVYTDFRDGLAATIKWYEEHPEWWRPLKEATESRYKELGR